MMTQRESFIIRNNYSIIQAPMGPGDSVGIVHSWQPPSFKFNHSS